MQGSPGLRALLRPRGSTRGQGLPDCQAGGGRELKNTSPEARLSSNLDCATCNSCDLGQGGSPLWAFLVAPL